MKQREVVTLVGDMKSVDYFYKMCSSFTEYKKLPLLVKGNKLYQTFVKRHWLHYNK